MERRQFLGCLAGAALWARPGPAVDEPPWRGEPWPAGEAMFRHEPRWLGGDSAYSIDLGGGRLLWLFGDSFIATSAALRRDQSRLVRNCVAIQQGADPLTADWRVYWRHSPGGPESFFADAPCDRWLWPFDGRHLGERLLLLQMILRATPGGLGFACCGWQAQLVANPDDAPDRWRLTTVPTPAEPALGVGCALCVYGEHLYAYATPLDQPSALYLARWPLAAAAAGRLERPEWSCGAGRWSASDRPVALLGSLQTEFSVIPWSAGWLMVHTAGFGAASLAARTAPAPDGPWSAPVTIYRPPEMDWPQAFIYSAKLHPALRGDGADLVASYNVNSFRFATLVGDARYYYPRLVKLRATAAPAASPRP